MREIDRSIYDAPTEVEYAVKELCDKKGVAHPSPEKIRNLVQRCLGSGSHSVELVAQDAVADWIEELKAASLGSGASEAVTQYASNGVASLVLVVAFKSVVEQFRSEVWGDASLPFENEDAACLWLELMHRLESKTGGYLKPENPLTFKLYESRSGWKTWLVPSGGVMEKLYRICETLSKKSEWWSTDNALKFILLGLVPGSVQVQPGGYGNYTKKVTITVHGPVPGAEVLRMYKQACESAHIEPQTLSHVHYRLLFLFHYLMPTASWPKRYKVWLEWCQADKKLPTYGGRLRENGTVEKPEGYRNLKREYKRAMKRQSWTGETPRLLRPGAEFERYWAPRREGFSLKKSPDPVWEEPDFDASGFESPQIDPNRLEAICQEAAKINPYPHEMNTFWEYYHRE